MKIPKTKSSPYINLSVEECKIEIKGPSYSENIDEIYKGVLKWMEKEIPKFNCELLCEFHFNVINSITHKNVLQTFQLLSDFQKAGKSITINWLADKDDEDIIELAGDISDLYSLKIKVIEV